MAVRKSLPAEDGELKFLALISPFYRMLRARGERMSTRDSSLQFLPRIGSAGGPDQARRSDREEHDRQSDVVKGDYVVRAG